MFLTYSIYISIRRRALWYFPCIIPGTSDKGDPFSKYIYCPPDSFLITSTLCLIHSRSTALVLSTGWTIIFSARPALVQKLAIPLQMLGILYQTLLSVLLLWAKDAFEYSLSVCVFCSRAHIKSNPLLTVFSLHCFTYFYINLFPALLVKAAMPPHLKMNR